MFVVLYVNIYDSGRNIISYPKNTCEETKYNSQSTTAARYLKRIVLKSFH